MSLPTVKILHCSCKHPQQDKLHGLNKRVCNRGQVKGTKENPYAEYKCTVCVTKHTEYK